MDPSHAFLRKKYTFQSKTQKMISVGVEKFLNLSELVERVLLLLDPSSALNLFQSGLVEKKVLKESLSSKVWKQLVLRCSFGEAWRIEMEDVRRMGQILKQLDLEDYTSYILPLLDTICQKFTYSGLGSRIEITCSCLKGAHSLQLDGFLLLEEVEAVFGTTLQNINTLKAHFVLGPLLSALSSRITRQTEAVSKIYIYHLILEDTESVRTLSNLSKAEEFHVVRVFARELEVEGWELLARVLETRPGTVVRFDTTKKSLDRGKREDIKAVWDNVGQYFMICEPVSDERRASMLLDKRADSWTTLLEILDMTKAQFIEKFTD